jgi:hypothetical protein
MGECLRSREYMMASLVVKRVRITGTIKGRRHMGQLCRPYENRSYEASKGSNDDKRQNLKPLPLVMKRDLKHNQLSVLQRIDPLQSHRRNDCAKKRPPHCFWREEGGHFLQRKQYATHRRAEADTHAYKNGHQDIAAKREEGALAGSSGARQQLSLLSFVEEVPAREDAISNREDAINIARKIGVLGESLGAHICDAASNMHKRSLLAERQTRAGRQDQANALDKVLQFCIG